MAIVSNRVPASVDWKAALDAAREHNKALFRNGNLPELPGQGDRIPLRECIGHSFVIKQVEFDASRFREGDEWARLTVVFEDDPGVERTITAGGAYVVNQLRRIPEGDLPSYLWTARELLSLKGKPIEQFNGYYPLVLDYANRPDQAVAESAK
jgi:hypothetical protein